MFPQRKHKISLMNPVHQNMGITSALSHCQDENEAFTSSDLKNKYFAEIPHNPPTLSTGVVLNKLSSYLINFPSHPPAHIYVEGVLIVAGSFHFHCFSSSRRAKQTPVLCLKSFCFFWEGATEAILTCYAWFQLSTSFSNLFPRHLFSQITFEARLVLLCFSTGLPWPECSTPDLVRCGGNHFSGW